MLNDARIEFVSAKRICSCRRKYKHVVSPDPFFCLAILYCDKCHHAWIIDGKDRRGCAV